jgi:Raf kinase inhibitor-like YbhB/YbcL family protein
MRKLALESTTPWHRGRGRAVLMMALAASAAFVASVPEAGAATSFTLESSAFRPQTEIPQRYTCEGRDTSPPLAWRNAPAGTKSFVVLVDDPDAPDPAKPQRTAVHWVVYNLPAREVRLTEGERSLPAGTVLGTNDFHKTGYSGPCPNVGRHRYFFKIYALDETLPPKMGATTQRKVERAMKGHVLAQTQIVGTYQKR